MPRMLQRALVLSLLLGAPAAAAEQAESLLREARARHAMAEFAEAVALLERALTKTDDPALLARIHFALGVNHSTLGQIGAAETAFRQALTLDPTLDADPRRFKRATVELFRLVRQRLEGILSVTSSCPDAEVFVDDRRLGVGPYQGRQPIGRRQVRVRCADGRERVEAVVVAPERQSTVRARFTTPVVALTGGPPSQTVPPPEPGSRRSFRPWAWGAAAAAVAATGVAVGFGVAANADHDAWRAERDDPARWDDLRASGRSKALTANISFGLGAALAATALVLFVLDRRATADKRSVPATAATSGHGPTSRRWP